MELGALIGKQRLTTPLSRTYCGFVRNAGSRIRLVLAFIRTPPVEEKHNPVDRRVAQLSDTWSKKAIS